MSKMSDDFKNKSALRNRATKMADGGLAGLRQRTIDGSVDPKPAAPTPVAAAPEPTEQEKAKSVGISIPKYVPPAPTPAPSMFSRLRKAVGLADGGSPWDSAYKPGGSLGVRATPAPIPTILARPPVQTAVEPSPAATPSPALAPASPAATPAAAPAPTQPTAAGSGLRTATVGEWNNMVDPAPKMSAADWNSQQNGSGMKMGLRGGGRVTGPGGPREDKVGPVMLSNGEYVLPAKTVKALGGPEEIDEMVRATNDGREPMHADPDDRGLRGAANGLSPWDPVVGQAPGVPSGAPAYTPPPQLPPPQPGTAVATRPYTPNWTYGGGAPAADPNVIDVRSSKIPAGGSPEMQAVRQAQAADQAGLRAGEAVRAAKAAAAAAPEAAAPSVVSRATGLAGRTAGAVGRGWLAAAPAAGVISTFNDSPETVQQWRNTGANPGEDPNSTVAGIRGATMRFLKNTGDFATLNGTSWLGNGIANMVAGLPFEGDGKKPTGPVPNAPAVGLHRQDPNVSAALAQNEMNAKAMDRNTPNTGGSILRTGNTFYGGNPDPNLTAQAAAEGRQRYQNDAAGMYAAIQGHIANGDLETANKLAWDPQSRALVNQGYAARNAAMAAASRSANPDEDALNSRFDKNADRLRGLFRSDRAQGNLAKHLAENERTRSGELANLRNTKTTQRGQDLLSESNQARIASEQAIANQRNALDWRRTMLEQTNKDREFGLNQQKYGFDVAKVMHDQSVEREKRNQEHIDKFVAGQFVGPDGKEDKGTAARFNEFVSSAYGDLGKISDKDRNSVLAKALNEFRMNERANASGSWFTGKTSSQYSPAGAPRHAELGDLVHGLGPTDYIRSKMAQVGVGNPDVVPFENGEVRRVKDVADNNTDRTALDRIYGLRNK